MRETMLVWELAMPAGDPVRFCLMIKGEVPLLSKAAACWLVPEVEHLMSFVASYHCDMSQHVQHAMYPSAIACHNHYLRRLGGNPKNMPCSRHAS